jgi:hypothetical protein
MITETPGLKEVYLRACHDAGVTPGVFIEAPPNPVTVAFVARDPDAAWERLGPHLLHDARTYAGWNREAGKRLNTLSDAATVDDLRRAGHPYRVFTPQQAAEHIAVHGSLSLAPLCGGTPPEMGWSTLRLVADEVLPRLSPR